MLDKKARLIVSTSIHPKEVLLSWGQDSVEASQILCASNWLIHGFMDLALCNNPQGHVEILIHKPQTVPTKLQCCSIRSSLTLEPKGQVHKKTHKSFPGTKIYP